MTYGQGMWIIGVVLGGTLAADFILYCAWRFYWFVFENAPTCRKEADRKSFLYSVVSSLIRLSYYTDWFEVWLASALISAVIVLAWPVALPVAFILGSAVFLRALVRKQKELIKEHVISMHKEET